jgi:hypothetical protein
MVDPSLKPDPARKGSYYRRISQRREVCRSSRIALRIRHEDADQSHSLGILCARRERQRDHHAAERGDELSHD